METTSEYELLMEIRRLADLMLRQDLWIADAYRRKKYSRVGELRLEREGVRQYRSDLMRDLFLMRRFSARALSRSNPGTL